MFTQPKNQAHFRPNYLAAAPPPHRSAVQAAQSQPNLQVPYLDLMHHTVLGPTHLPIWFPHLPLPITPAGRLTQGTFPTAHALVPFHSFAPGQALPLCVQRTTETGWPATASGAPAPRYTGAFAAHHPVPAPLLGHAAGTGHGVRWPSQAQGANSQPRS